LNEKARSKEKITISENNTKYLLKNNQFKTKWLFFNAAHNETVIFQRASNNKINKKKEKVLALTACTGTPEEM